MAGFADFLLFIDSIVANYENLSSSDADNTARRARILHFGQAALDEIWFSGDYSFTYTTGTVTVAAGSESGDLPADFFEFGEAGGIIDNATKEQLSEIRPITQYRAVVVGESGDARFGIAGYGWNASTQRRTLKLLGTAGSAQTLKILYRTTSPTLLDATGSTSNLWYLPAQYHNTVLLPLIIYKIKDSLGDARANKFLGSYQSGLAMMASRERHRKTTTQVLPSSIRIF